MLLVIKNQEKTQYTFQGERNNYVRHPLFPGASHVDTYLVSSNINREVDTYFYFHSHRDHGVVANTEHLLQSRDSVVPLHRRQNVPSPQKSGYKGRAQKYNYVAISVDKLLVL